MKYKKAIIILTCFCIAAFIIFITFNAGIKLGMKYTSNQKLNEDRKHYVNHFYFQLYETVYLLSSADDWGESIHSTDITVNPYRQLLNQLSSMKSLSEQAYWYMRYDSEIFFLNKLSDSFKFLELSIGSGISTNGQLICVDFLEDGNLSGNEVSFLVSLKQDLESMQNNLYSEETKQENPNLTMKELSEAVKTFTDRYSINNLHNIGLRN